MAVYYFDATGGSDANDGLTQGTAWQTTSKFRSETFAAGDIVLFKRGETFEGLLKLNADGTLANPVSIGAYGSGSLPTITNTTVDDGFSRYRGFYVDKNHVVIENINFDGIIYAGINQEAGKTGLTVNNCSFINCGMDVRIKGDNTVVTNNTFGQGVMVDDSGDANDYGAVAVALEPNSLGSSSNHTIADNIMEDKIAPSVQFGQDGGCLEIFGNVDDVVFERNFINNVKGIFEVGGRSEGEVCNNYTARHNVAYDFYGIVLYVNDPAGDFGAEINNWVIDHNSFYESTENRSPIWFAGSPTVNSTTLKFRNNIWSGLASFANRFDFETSGNILENRSGGLGFTPDSTNTIAAPGFTNAAAGDFSLTVGAAGLDHSPSLGYTGDYNNNAINVYPSGNVDAGAISSEVTAQLALKFANSIELTDNTSNTFIADSNHLKGGVHSVADTTARDAIPSARLVNGLICHVSANSTYYKWNGSAWETLSLGGGSVAGSNTQIQYNNSGSFGANSNFVFDGTRLGIGTTTPTTEGSTVLHVNNSGATYNSASGGMDGVVAVFSNNATSTSNTVVSLFSGGDGQSDIIFSSAAWGNRGRIRYDHSNETFDIRANSTTQLILSGTTVSMPNLPTSTTGLSAGDLWNDAGTIKIV